MDPTGPLIRCPRLEDSSDNVHIYSLCINNPNPNILELDRNPWLDEVIWLQPKYNLIIR